MCGVRAFLGIAALLIALVAAAEPSSAEGLLRRLFGGFVARLPEYRFNFSRMGPSGYGGEERYDGGSWQEDFGSYRTLCVRVCDGFYFPISDGVRRERLYNDAHQCAQRCDGEVRLFYYPTAGGSVETMVDLRGNRYADTPNAFRYRKALVKGCTCKPAPWSPQEAARHQGYAAQTAQTAGQPVDDPRQAAQASRQASRAPSPYDNAPRGANGHGPQTPWDRNWDHD
jgi:Protein of unknown function (DUF2865)